MSEGNMINFYLCQSFIFTNRNPGEFNVDKRDLDSINSTISSSDQIQKQDVIENRNTVETPISIRSSSLSSEDLPEVVGTLFHQSRKEDYPRCTRQPHFRW